MIYNYDGESPPNLLSALPGFKIPTSTYYNHLYSKDICPYIIRLK
ncbi:hypothetical protein [Ferruginibacter sp. SUN106]